VKKGFTLVEVVVVTALILLVSLVGIQTADVVSQREKEERLRYSLLEMRSALDLYFQDRLTFPATITELLTQPRLLNGSNYGFYLRRIPLNPFFNSEHWTYATGTFDVNGTPKTVVVDVFCPSQGNTAMDQAIDNSFYTEW